MGTRRAEADRAAAERAAAERASERAETSRVAVQERDETVADHTPEAPAGPRPRASLMAALGMLVGAVASLIVLTGVLAGYGVALGVLGLFLSIGGISATSRRHVAGRSIAMFGAVLSIAAMVFGALALTGSLSWLTTETDKVDQLKQWLDTEFAARF